MPQTRASEDPIVRLTTFRTDLGWMALAFQEDLITAATFGHGSAKRAAERLKHQAVTVSSIAATTSATGPAAAAIERLQSYAAGHVVDFDDMELDLEGLTSFQRRVIIACRRIPWGTTITYAQLAARARSPRAYRAVGNVMAGNRFPIIVPCHRVIGSHGSLGGYSAPSGLKMKKRLLRLEKSV